MQVVKKINASNPFTYNHTIPMQEDLKKVSPDNSGSKYSDIYEEARDKVFGKLINERINTDLRGKDFLKRKLDREGYEIVRKNTDLLSEK